jgi:hypothetical protein
MRGMRRAKMEEWVRNGRRRQIVGNSGNYENRRWAKEREKKIIVEEENSKSLNK